MKLKYTSAFSLITAILIGITVNAISLIEPNKIKLVKIENQTRSELIIKDESSKNVATIRRGETKVVNKMIPLNKLNESRQDKALYVIRPGNKNPKLSLSIVREVEPDGKVYLGLALYTPNEYRVDDKVFEKKYPENNDQYNVTLIFKGTDLTDSKIEATETAV